MLLHTKCIIKDHQFFKVSFMAVHDKNFCLIAKQLCLRAQRLQLLYYS